MVAIRPVEKVVQGEADGRARHQRAHLHSNVSRLVGARAGGGARILAGFAARAVGETIYATRCVICDTPGSDLCNICRLHLPYIDRYLACRHCGAPFGFLQCTECSSQALAEVDRESLPFDGCVGAIEHRGRARSIVTAYKDAGQRQLARTMAAMMRSAIPPAWVVPSTVIAPIPADAHARRRRGFDHMQVLAEFLARLLGLPLSTLLVKEVVADQRGLSRRERFANMAGRIHVASGAIVPACVLVVDDVHTTGATLFAASDALRASGAQRILCATFARAM